MKTSSLVLFAVAVVAFLGSAPGFAQETTADAKHPIVLHAARLFDVEAGKIVTPGEVLVEGERIVAAGTSVRASGGGGGD